MNKKLLFICTLGNSSLLLTLAIYFFIWPLFIVVKDLNEPSLHNGEIPNFTYRWHRDISKNFPDWANNRIDSNQATSLDINNISGTEWPMFSAVYFLWATEELQKNWLLDPTVSEEAPTDYAKDAIEAAARLITDYGNAAWVIKHWGDEYLERENLFYRMLLISGLTSFQNLLSDTTYEDLLRQQVVSLAEELDNSPYGLLDDYPGQSYPVDILPAITAISRAEKISGVNFDNFINRAKRGFSGDVLDPNTQLPAYFTDSKSGKGYGPARGVGMSYMLTWAAEIWPIESQEWYEKFEYHFWKQNWFMAGIREFPITSNYPSWSIDVDAGPVIAEYGTAASAFGIAASRVNGRFDHSFPLSAQAIATAWPLPNGTLLMPRFLSNLSDAPLIGETALLFIFTRPPITQSITTPNTLQLPLFVYLMLLVYFLLGLIFIWSAYTRFSDYQLQKKAHQFYQPKLQFAVWLCILTCGIAAFITGKSLITASCILVLLFLPMKVINSTQY